MAFATPVLNDPQKVGPGTRTSDMTVVLSAREFEDGLKVGRFAKLDTGRLDNMDGSSTPVIAGVVLRMVTNAVESGDTIDSSSFSVADYIRQGIAIVGVKSGETPTQFGRVYVSNAGNANDGLATATNTDVAVNAEFIQEIDTNVWMIYVNPAPGDIAAHIAATPGAHAASAISLLDTAGLTASDDVEEVVAEMLPAVARTASIADPGNAGAIPVTRSGNVAMTTGASGETRTLASPTKTGLMLSLTHTVDGGGAAVVAAAAAVNQTGNNRITFADAGDFVLLTSVTIAGAIVWRVVVNDGAALSTV